VHTSACSLVFFLQGRETAALWCQGRTGKTSGPLGAGDSCRSISSLAPHAPHRKTKGTHAVRVTLFHPSMDTKGVDCPKRKGHHNGTQTRPFVSLPERLPRPGEKGRQLSSSSRLPRCFAVPSGWGKKRSSTLLCGRRTDARLGHGVVTIHSGSYWIITTLEYIAKIRGREGMAIN
jgi:hypothetical protein